MKLPNWLRAGIATAFFVAVPGFILSLTNWLGDFAEWLAGEDVSFPDISALRSATVAFGFAILFGAINSLVRYLQERGNVGTAPVYPTTRNPPQ